MNTAIIGLMGLVFSIVMAVIGFLLRQAFLEAKEGIAQLEIRLTKAIGESKAEMDKGFGETFLAFRQKITDVELYIRDNFVRKETFGPVMTKLEGDVKLVGDRIEARLLRMESKIDRQNDGAH